MIFDQTQAHPLWFITNCESTLTPFWGWYTNSEDDQRNHPLAPERRYYSGVLLNTHLFKKDYLAPQQGFRLLQEWWRHTRPGHPNHLRATNFRQPRCENTFGVDLANCRTYTYSVLRPYTVKPTTSKLQFAHSDGHALNKDCVAATRKSRAIRYIGHRDRSYDGGPWHGA